MDEVGGDYENENEDQVLARALEESLRYYKEVEVPRLSQITKNSEVRNEKFQETMPEEDMDCWEEWDVEDISAAVLMEESAVHISKDERNGIINKKNSLGNSTASAKLMNNYVIHEIRPKQTCISVGEVGEHGADGFDMESGRLWIYPSNYPVRKYQLDIVHSALFDNTLVSLPTGLGKTFIAAVIMYNFYRWFPMGKIIFLAPTRPLVAQQVHACYEIMGIPKSDTLELTGSKNPSERAKGWKEKRVFFATPHVAANDLATGACPGDLIRCVVVDEAHRATGNHAYCQAIRCLIRLREQSPGSRFRILALSATPGKNIPSVADVITALQISKLELRDEQSTDVAPYTHQRNIETVVVPIGPELNETRTEFLKTLIPVLDRLMKKKVLYCGDKSKVSKFQILAARDNFRSNSQKFGYQDRGYIEGDFALAITLSHALGLLMTHGQRTFMNFLQGIIDGDRGTPIVKSRLNSDVVLPSLLSKLKEKFGDAESMLQPAPDVPLSQNMAGATEARNVGKPFITSHPKMDFLKDIIIDHFEKFGEETRVMVFCEYRDPVVEICNMLMRFWPKIKPMKFVGQAMPSVGFDNKPKTSKGTKGFKQRQQLQAIHGFREGGYNVLVSTCVGEEGLDIGEVDLIICYDAPHASPLRLVQRMGRTGRKREGRVVTLVTQDWEENKHRQGLRQKSTIVKSLMSSKVLANALCRNNPRVLPPGINPKCHIMPMVLANENDNDIDKERKKGKAKGNKSKNPSNIKKSKGKGGDNIAADGRAGYEGVDDNNECEMGGELESEMGIDKKEKKRGKTKGKTKKSKPSPTKNQRKGIQDFFKNHRLKDDEPIFDVDEEFEDDDFIGVCKQEKKNLDEVVALEHHELVSESEYDALRNRADHIDFSLFPDLQILESAATRIFGISHCHCMNNNVPSKCSEMAVHFQLRRTTIDFSYLHVDISLEFLTEEILLNFNPKDEARKAGDWNLDLPLIPEDEFIINTTPKNIKEHPSTRLIGKYTQDYSYKNSIVENYICDDRRKSKIFMGNDSDNRSCKEKSFSKKRAQNIGNNNFNLNSNTKESNVLWNMFGQQNEKKMAPDEDVIVLEDDEEVGNQIKEAEVSDHDERKESKYHKEKESENFSESKGIPLSKDNSYDFNIGHLNFSGDSTPDHVHFMEATPSKSNSLIHIKKPSNSHLHTPKTANLESTHLSAEATPDHLQSPQESAFKSTICLSPIIGNRKGNFVVTSSTPKVHRKNLFPSNLCHSTPFNPDKCISNNAHRVSSDTDLSDHKKILPINKKQVSLEENEVSIFREVKHFVDLECEEDYEKNNYMTPNFDLGWDDAFDSDATFLDSDEGTCEEMKVNEKINGRDAISPLIKKYPKILDSQLIDSKKEAKVNEKVNDSSKSYVEISSEVCSNGKKKTSYIAAKDKLLKQKNKDGVESQQNHSHFYTVTQMIDLLDTDIPSISHEIKENRADKHKEILIEEEEDVVYNFKSESELSKINSEVREGFEKSPNKKLKIEALENGIIEGNCLGKDKEIVPQDINFDIGDDILLDVSADLFAEDDTEDWLRESGTKGGENQNIKEEFVGEEKKNLENDKSMPATCKINENLNKSPDKDLRLDGNQKVETLSKQIKRTEPKILNNIMPIPSVVGFRCWSSDYFTRTVPAKNNKLSLSRKNNNKEEQLKEPLSVNKVLSSSNRDLFHSKGMKADEVIKPKCNEKSFQEKDYDGSGWIDKITTVRKDQIPCTSSNSAKVMADKFLISHKKKPVDSEGTEKCRLESTDKMNGDLTPERNSSFKFKCPDSAVSGKRSISSFRSKVTVVKPVGTNEIITLSDEDETDCEIEEQSGNHENLLKKVDEDVGEWELSDWEGIEESEAKYQEPSGSSDDFESLENGKQPKRTPINSSKGTSFSSEDQPLIRPRKVSRNKKRCEFLESQAEESFCDPGTRKLSSDEDDDCDKGNSQYYDPSFINDGLPHSEDEEVDIQAKYLQSVRSPRNPKFKIPDLPAIISLGASNPEAFGDDQSESCYLNDSFCIDGESEENVSEGNPESSIDELEVLEAILSEKTRKKKRKIESSSEDEVKVLSMKKCSNEKDLKNKKLKRKRKRIIMHDSSEEDEIPKHCSLSKKTSFDRNTSPECKQRNRSSKELATTTSSKKDKNEESPPILNSTDSRGITERRMSQLSVDISNKTVINVENKMDNSDKSISNNILKNSESVVPSISGMIGNAKMTKEINCNWSGDIFDMWNLDDDHEWESEIANLPSLPNKEGKKEESDLKHQSSNSGKQECTTGESVFKLSKSHHSNTEIKNVVLTDESKIFPKTGTGFSSDNVCESRLTVENFCNEEFIFHSKETSTSRVKTGVTTPLVNSHTSASTSKMVADFETLIVVSPTEACLATDIVSTLRTTRKIQVVVFAAPGTSFIPYALGRELCLFRLSASDLGHGSATEHLQASRKFYKKVSVILEWGDETPRDNWPQKRNSVWSSSSNTTGLNSSLCSALINLGKAKIQVLHSSGKRETAFLIIEVARHYQMLEVNSGMEPITLPKPFNQSDPKLKFYSSLPGVNVVQAINIMKKFPKISEFLSRCTSVRSIQSATGLDLAKSLELYKILSSVHTA